MKNKTSDCPKDGVCSFDVLKNKAFLVKTDKFGNSYSELLDGNKIVLKFEYSRNVPKDLQDASYREIIYIEIAAEGEALELKGNSLQKAKVSFERLCFCRGQTGCYAITEGSLSIKELKKDKYHLTLDFKTDKVPQVITSITETFSL